MPLGAARLTLLAKSSVTAVAEVIRKKFDLTAIGNAQIDTAQSQFGGSSLLLDGTGDWLKHNDDNGTFQFGSNDFTIEAWINPSAINTSGSPIEPIWNKYNTSNSQRMLSFGIYDGFLGYFWASSGSSGNAVQTTQAISTGSWKHVALCREGNTWNTYYDGTRVDTRTISATLHASTEPVYIGSYFGTANNEINGYIDELRVSDNARYTGASYTVPTSAFTNDDNTLLLLHMNGTDGSTFFEDDNGVGRSAIGLIADDNARIDTAQSKFGGTSAEFPSTYGWLQTGAVNAFAVSGDWTKEFWVYYNKSDADQYIHHNRGGYASGTFQIYTTSVGNVRASFNDGGIGRDINTTFSTGQWYHYAFVNNSGTITWYIDGSSVGTASWSSTINDPDKTLRWGAFSAGGSTDKFEGWIDEYRFSNTARYTSGFTPSTTPFVNDANTLLLLHMDGTDGSTDFRDDNGVGRSAVGLTALGNAQVDTAQSKFGIASGLFDGTGDGIDCNKPLLPATADWTVEMWVYPTSIAATDYFFTQYSLGAAGRTGMYHTNTGAVGLFINGGPSFTTTGTISTGSWQHLAWVRNGSSFKTYINGTEEGSGTGSPSIQQIDSIVGKINSSGGTDDFIGNIDEVRISDTARYTTGFTPSTEPFQNDANTLLLLHCNGTDGSTTFIDDNGVTTAGQGA